MAESNITALGLILGMRKPIEIPEALRDFLSLDDQGMDGLEFMLKSEKHCKRIPPEVRLEYETLYCILSQELEENLKEVEQAIQSVRSNPQQIIHQLIQKSYEAEK